MFETLSLKEVAVLRSLFSQCVKNCGTIFIPDRIEALKYLFSIGALLKYRLGITEWSEVVEDLTNRKIIKTDRIVDADYLKTYYAKYYPGQQPPIKPDTKYYWLHNTDWAYKKLQFGGLVSIDDIQKKYGCNLFINMSLDDMHDIEEQRIASHMVYLKLDKTKCCLCIKFDKEKKWRELTPHMNPESTTFKILCAAYENANKEMTAGELGFKDEKYLDTKVFAKTRIVQALSPQLIELAHVAMTFRTKAAVTQARFEQLKKDLKIS